MLETLPKKNETGIFQYTPLVLAPSSKLNLGVKKISQELWHVAKILLEVQQKVWKCEFSSYCLFGKDGKNFIQNYKISKNCIFSFKT